MSEGSNKNQRLTNMLLDHWTAKRGGAEYPDEMSLDFDYLEEVLDDCFVVSVIPSDFKYKFVGENIKNVYGGDLTDIYLSSLDSPAIDHVRDIFNEVVKTHVPVYDDGEFKRPDGREVKFRQVVLPLGKGRVTSLLGGMRYKIFD